MKGSLVILGLAVIFAVGMFLPSSAPAVSCPTTALSAAETASGFNCQLGSLGAPGASSSIPALAQTLSGSSSGSDSQDSGATDSSGAGLAFGSSLGSGLHMGRNGLSLGTSSPSSGSSGGSSGSVSFFGPQQMIAVSSDGGSPLGGLSGQQGPLGGSAGGQSTAAAPEPASLVLLGSGLVVLGGAAFRRYRRRQIQAL